MSSIYFLGRIFPAICVGLLLAFYEILKNLRRKRSKLVIPMAALAGLFFILGILWIVFRGDLHSDEWIKSGIEHFQVTE